MGGYYHCMFRLERETRLELATRAALKGQQSAWEALGEAGHYRRTCATNDSVVEHLPPEAVGLWASIWGNLAQSWIMILPPAIVRSVT